MYAHRQALAVKNNRDSLCHGEQYDTREQKTKTILSRADFNAAFMSTVSTSLSTSLITGFRWGLNALVPPACPLCGTFLRTQAGLCGDCWQSLGFITGPICRVSGQPMAVDLGAETISPAARVHPPP